MRTLEEKVGELRAHLDEKRRVGESARVTEEEVTTLEVLTDIALSLRALVALKRQELEARA